MALYLPPSPHRRVRRRNICPTSSRSSPVHLPPAMFLLVIFASAGRVAPFHLRTLTTARPSRSGTAVDFLQQTSPLLFLSSTSPSADMGLSPPSAAHSDVSSSKVYGGRRFVIRTPAGSINLFGAYFGFLSIVLGLVWGVALLTCSIFYKVTGGRFDRMKKIPVFCSHVWGTALLAFSRSMPVVENRQVLTDLYKANKTAMFIANHNSWMDIPFMGSTIGWRNYKIVAKKELLNVPILGAAISLGGNVVVDRKNRKSQLLTLRTGVRWLKVRHQFVNLFYSLHY
uniref:Phospholipid/glycerol acyltransferase domain-containing protein n=1 Tax=Corethron hystrix TaxID=216773 RepID=A0A7S1C0Z0_9STRA|mmetsp:Transcript_9778/g.21774  ORF Transcript_9778/g.21774 Transcript_9778/m.21774 type:complete len:284 (+) Transcript_9778:151-1002(+)